MARVIVGLCACLLIFGAGSVRAQEQVAQLPIPSPSVLILGVRAQQDSEKADNKKKDDKKPTANKKDDSKKDDSKKDEQKPDPCADVKDCDNSVKDCTVEMKAMKEHQPEIEKQPIRNEDPKGNLPLVEIEEKFYTTFLEFQGTVPVPSEVSRKVEKIQFERKTYTVGDCQYTVCMPTHQCVITSKTCELRPTQVKLEACLRNCDQNFDVYVLEVPGMPARWPVMVGASKTEVEKRFNIKLDQLKAKK